MGKLMDIREILIEAYRVHAISVFPRNLPNARTSLGIFRDISRASTDGSCVAQRELLPVRTMGRRVGKKGERRVKEGVWSGCPEHVAPVGVSRWNRLPGEIPSVEIRAAGG